MYFRSPRLVLAEFRTSRFYGCPRYLQEWKSEEYPIKNEGARMVTRLYNDFQVLKGSYFRSQQ